MSDEQRIYITRRRDRIWAKSVRLMRTDETPESDLNDALAELYVLGAQIVDIKLVPPSERESTQSHGLAVILFGVPDDVPEGDRS